MITCIEKRGNDKKENAFKDQIERDKKKEMIGQTEASRQKDRKIDG